MKRTISFLLFFLIVPMVCANAQAPTPIGPASWVKPDGRIQRSIGPGGAPILNYQLPNGDWAVIDDDWTQVGQKQVWKSVTGRHRVFADSTGAAIYAVGDHYLGTKTTRLIKFDKSDSSWTTLMLADVDSVTMSGRNITQHGIFFGVDKVLINNAKVFQSFSEMFLFSQAFRDSVEKLGPWNNHLLGTVTRLDTDSLNVIWQDAVGPFAPGSSWRLTDGYFDARWGGARVFAIGTSFLNADTTLTDIPVRKAIVLFNGNPFLVELFNPALTVGIRPGPIWHNAKFGRTTVFGVSYGPMGDLIFGSPYNCPDNGTADSVTVYGYVNHATNPANIKIGVMDYHGPDTDADNFIEDARSVPGGGFPDGLGWYGVAITKSLTGHASDHNYLLYHRAEDDVWRGAMTDATSDTTYWELSFTYSTTTPDPWTGRSVHDPTRSFVIYVTYTIDAVSPRRQKITKGSN